MWAVALLTMSALVGVSVAARQSAASRCCAPGATRYVSVSATAGRTATAAADDASDDEFDDLLLEESREWHGPVASVPGPRTVSAFRGAVAHGASRLADGATSTGLDAGLPYMEEALRDPLPEDPLERASKLLAGVNRAVEAEEEEADKRLFTF